MFSFAAIGSSCGYGDYVSGSCNPNGASAIIFGIFLVAVIVGIVFFAWWWKWGNRNGRVGRFVRFVSAKLGLTGRR
jgi:sulfite exporter TauE/SafE